MGHLSTHVLDTSRGAPAAGVFVEVRTAGVSEPVATATTNAQGRTEAALLPDRLMQRGEYELTFHVGDYFRRNGVAMPDPPFLDRVVIRIGIADPSATYHVPLLISPYGYSTYRGT